MHQPKPAGGETHTPTPWRQDEHVVLAKDHGIIIASCPVISDAAHIVRCVNERDELVGACRALESKILDIHHAVAGSDTAWIADLPTYYKTIGVWEAFRAALQKAHQP